MTNTGTLTLKVPWGLIAAKTWGKPEDTRVLVVHGILDNAGAFDRLIALLPKHFYYVCIDLPGHGLSSHLPKSIVLDYLTYLLTIRYILDALQWQTAYYMGHSFGAHLGILFATVYPERISRLIAIDAIIAVPYSNSELISSIKLHHDAIYQAKKIKNPQSYTKEQVMYALRNLRSCCITMEAARHLFERSTSKVGNDAYCYTRDYRLKERMLCFTLDQSLHLLKQLKVKTLILWVPNTLLDFQKTRQLVLEALKSIDCVSAIKIQGNHDVHNNYPERISGHISEFLNYIPNKL